MQGKGRGTPGKDEYNEERQRDGGREQVEDCTPPPKKIDNVGQMQKRSKKQRERAAAGLRRLLLGVVAWVNLVVMVMDVGVEEGIWRMALIVALARR